MKDYLRCVAAIDQNVGRLLEYLEKSGLDNNTIVDHFDQLTKNGFYDDVTMSVLNLSSGQRIDAMVRPSPVLLMSL